MQVIFLNTTMSAVVLREAGQLPQRATLWRICSLCPPIRCRKTSERSNMCSDFLRCAGICALNTLSTRWQLNRWERRRPQVSASQSCAQARRQWYWRTNSALTPRSCSLVSSPSHRQSSRREVDPRWPRVACLGPLDYSVGLARVSWRHAEKQLKQ